MTLSGAQSWGVVCTADEPLALLCAFALHHLSTGAGEVHLFLDQPRPGFRAVLDRIDGVIVYDGDTVSSKPSIEKRQLENAHTAQQRAGVAWLAHVDSDEFIAQTAGDSLASLLGALPDKVDYVTLPMRERAYAEGEPLRSVFDGGTVAPYDIARNVPAPTTALARRSIFAGRGLLAHATGKSFTRTGRPILPGIHRPRPRADHPQKKLKRRALTEHQITNEAALIHFDGLTPFHWAAKLWRMARFMPDNMLDIQQPGRRALIRLARRTLPDISPIFAIADDVRHLDPASIDALRGARAWHDMAIDPAEPVIAAGLLAPDAYTPTAFDEALIEMYPQLAEFREVLDKAA